MSDPGYRLTCELDVGGDGAELALGAAGVGTQVRTLHLVDGQSVAGALLPLAVTHLVQCGFPVPVPGHLQERSGHLQTDRSGPLQ